MKIKNIDGLSAADLQQEVSKGGRFVFYRITVSFFVVTFKRNSGVYLIRANEDAARKGTPFTLLSAFFGWWGLPCGPKHTIVAIRENRAGGADVTDEVMATVAGYILFEKAEAAKTKVVNP